MEVCVYDTGCGISRSQIDSIFTSFVKARGSDDEKEGTGLGLSITKAIVEAHGGSIWAESTRRKGSSFYFTVPLALYDWLYCGLYLGHGIEFVSRYWYLSVYYAIPWILLPLMALLLNRTHPGQMENAGST